MKSIEEIKDKIIEIITPVVKALGIELYNVEFSKMRSKGLLRVFIEKEGGVTIDDCERVSHEVEAVLDVEDPVPFSYVLEVSSPGLDRPIKELKDFKRYVGKTVRIITHEPVDKESFFVGTLADAGDNEISLLMPKDRRVIIPYKNISKARLEVEV